MVPTRFDQRPVAARAAALAAGCLALAMGGPAAAAPLRLSLDAVAAPGPTAGAVAPATAVDLPAAEPGDDLTFFAAPDLPFPEADAVISVGTPDDDWLQSARVQHDEAAVGADRHLGEFAPAVPAALRISADPIDEIVLPAARPEPAAPGPAPGSVTGPGLFGGPGWAWAAVPVLALLLMMAAAVWRTGRRSRGDGRAAA